MRRRVKPAPDLLTAVPPPFVDDLSLSVKVRKRRWQSWVDDYYEPMAAAFEKHEAEFGPFDSAGDLIEMPFEIPDEPWDPDDV